LILGILTGFIALQHIAFAILEIFFWNKPLGRKIFGTNESFAKQSRALAANQRLYNLFLSAALLASFFVTEPISSTFRLYGFCCVLAAGIFGALTVNKRIFLVQGIPPIFALIWIFTR
jgi:putative membrane protein